MGLFEHWPYTNFHELNLNWIISQVKRLSEGASGIPELVKQAQESAEAAARAAAEAQEARDYNNADDTVSCEYLGSWISAPGVIPSSAVLIGGTLYAFDATSNADNMGRLRVFDTESNLNLPGSEKTIRLQHANSACLNTNDNSVYIVPTWDFTGGQQVNASYLLKYDTSFTNLEIISTPTQAMGVSFDDVTGAMYYFDYAWNIYAYVNGAWELYTYVDNSAVNDYIHFNQDFCINNNVFHISAPAGEILTGYLNKGVSKITGHAVIRHSDIFENYYIGELEGFEYFNGKLYAVALSNMNGGYRTGFCLQLGFETNTAADLTGNQGKTNRTISINRETAGKFKLAPYELQSLAQNNILIFEPDTYSISKTGESFTDPVDGDIALYKSCRLRLLGSYTLKDLELGAGHFDIRPDNINSVMTFTGQIGIEHDRGSTLEIGAPGSEEMKITMPNVSAADLPLVYIGDSRNMTIVRNIISSAENKPV